MRFGTRFVGRNCFLTVWLGLFMLQAMLAPPLRLRRITGPACERALLLSFTSGMQLGRVPGIEDLAQLVKEFSSRHWMTGAIVHAGVLDRLEPRMPDAAGGMVVDLFGGTWLHTQGDEQICTLRHAVRVGADAVLTTVMLGAKGESRRLRVTGSIARECRDWGLPLIVRIDTSQTDARRQFSATLAGHGARLAYELGADMVVVPYSGKRETFNEALRGIDIPVLVGGSPRMANDQELVASVEEAIECGGRGVCLPGEMFWQQGAPSEVLGQLHHTVFGVTGESPS